jgi:hypothetical protein
MLRVFLQLGGWIELTALALVTLVAGGARVASLGTGAQLPGPTWFAIGLALVAAN